jgi:hypothetical protein
MQNKVEKWQKEFIENSWMGLGDTSLIKTPNPFTNRTNYHIENPHIFVLDLMRNPDYFFFTCKHLFNIELYPFQLAILRELWIRSFPMLIGSRGLSKSFMLAVYSLLRAIFCQGSKIVIVGAAFRQSKVVFDYCQEIWDRSAVLRTMVGDDRKNGPRRDVDRCHFRIGESMIIALPIGDGSKVRGQRGQFVLAEEFASIPVEIFETVIRGFAAVSMSPTEKAKAESRKKAIKELGMWNEELENETAGAMSNQAVLSGTCYWQFNHFYSYWKKYKAIIESRGDQNKLSEVFGGEIPPKFNWKDYSIIRIPYKFLPDGFMDEKMISQAKATMHSGIYMMEYAAVFPSDSSGFFKRSLIESCVVGKDSNPITKECGVVRFNATLYGDKGRRYVMGVDPASELDNFSIVILELWSDHRRVVYCWTTTRSRFKNKVKAGIVNENDFYGYTARKIRDLNKEFPCLRISLDKMGGGIAVLEALQDKNRLQPGEHPFYPIIIPDEPAETDGLAGEHTIEIVNFAQADYVLGANHGLRQDLEKKNILFPEHDTLVTALALEEDKEAGRIKVDQEGLLEKLYDTLEDCVLEIEDLKDELCTIVHTQTGTSNRDRFSTPETKGVGGKKGTLRKDRYSALLMANMTARVLANTPAEPEYKPYGGFARSVARDKVQGPMYIGPSWYNNPAGANAYQIVRRGV